MYLSSTQITVTKMPRCEQEACMMYSLWLYWTLPYTMYSLPDTGKLGGILQGIVTSRDVDFLGDEALSRPLSEVRGGEKVGEG